MPLSSFDVQRGLQKKGFTARQNDHTFFYYKTLEGQKTDVWTKVSHGSKKDIDDSLITQMSHQCKLQRKDFIALINCPLKREKYEEILRRQGEI